MVATSLVMVENGDKYEVWKVDLVSNGLKDVCTCWRQVTWFCLREPRKGSYSAGTKYLDHRKSHVAPFSRMVFESACSYKYSPVYSCWLHHMATAAFLIREAFKWNFWKNLGFCPNWGLWDVEGRRRWAHDVEGRRHWGQRDVEPRPRWETEMQYGFQKKY